MAEGRRAYIHGDSERESDRLHDQAETLTELLHSDTRYPAGSLVLEAGCGVGAQTVILAENSPGAAIVSVDIAASSVLQARRRDPGVRFGQADIMHLPFRDGTFCYTFFRGTGVK